MNGFDVLKLEILNLGIEKRFLRKKDIDGEEEHQIIVLLLDWMIILEHDLLILGSYMLIYFLGWDFLRGL